MSEGVTTRNSGMGKNLGTVSSMRASWKTEHIDILLDLILEVVDKGEVFIDKNLKTHLWNNIVQNFNDRTNCGYDKEQLQNCFSVLKKKYMTYQGIKDNSGFGYDEATGLFTASEEVWNSYIACHKEAKALRTKPFAFYEKCFRIFN